MDNGELMVVLGNEGMAWDLWIAFLAMMIGEHLA
jgi:hypothetical protein